MAGQGAVSNLENKKDEWVLFRLTDVGIIYCKENSFPEDAVDYRINGKPIVEEVSHRSVWSDALRAKHCLSIEERSRTIIQLR
ncbi:MAG: hypothetical protein AAB446_01155 [Patescibacteria group bacterium]